MSDKIRVEETKNEEPIEVKSEAFPKIKKSKLKKAKFRRTVNRITPKSVKPVEEKKLENPQKKNKRTPLKTASFPAPKNPGMFKLKQKIVKFIREYKKDLVRKYEEEIPFLWNLLLQLNPKASQWGVQDWIDEHNVFLLSTKTDNKTEPQKVNLYDGYELLRGVVIAKEGILAYSYSYSRINICEIKPQMNNNISILQNINDNNDNNDMKLFINENNKKVEYNDEQVTIKQYVEGIISIRLFVYKGIVYLCNDKHLLFQNKINSRWSNVNLNKLVIDFFSDDDDILDFSDFIKVSELQNGNVCSSNFFQLMFMSSKLSRSSIYNLGNETKCVILNNLKNHIHFDTEVQLSQPKSANLDKIPYVIDENFTNKYISLNELTIKDAYKIMYNPYIKDMTEKEQSNLIAFYERANKSKDTKVMKCNPIHITLKTGTFTTNIRGVSFASYISNSLTNDAGLWGKYYANLDLVSKNIKDYLDNASNLRNNTFLINIIGYYSAFDCRRFIDKDELNDDDYDIIIEKMTGGNLSYLEDLHYVSETKSITTLLVKIKATLDYYLKNESESDPDIKTRNLIDLKRELFMIVLINYIYHTTDNRIECFNLERDNNRNFSPSEILRNSLEYFQVVTKNLKIDATASQLYTLGIKDVKKMEVNKIYGTLLNSNNQLDEAIIIQFYNNPLAYYRLYKVLKSLYERYIILVDYFNKNSTNYQDIEELFEMFEQDDETSYEFFRNIRENKD